MRKIKINNFTFSILDMLYFIGTIVSIFICGLSQPKYYESLVFLPFCFLICFIMVSTIGEKGSLTINIAFFCAFLRYAILPLFQSINPIYEFANYGCVDTYLINKSIFLMCYELLFISAFFIIYSRTHKKKANNFVGLSERNGNAIERFPSKCNRQGIIFIFCCLSMFICSLNPKFFKQISFLIIKSNSGERVGSISSSSNSVDTILRQIFIIGIFSLFIILITILKKKYYTIKPKMIVNVALFAALCCICIIISEQRSSQVYCAFASVILMVQMFPEYRKKIYKIIIVGASIVLVMLTIYKTFYAFKYGSYWDAISNSSSNMNDLVQTMEIYLLGPLTVSSAIEFGSAFGNISLSQLLYDICRSSIGISFLVKGQDAVLTSANYNLFVTSGNYTSGFLLPITGQGYLVFGFAFAPVLICFCFYLAFKLEKIMFTNKSAYVVYFSAYVFIRLSTCIVSSNLNTVLNAVTSILISAGMVYMLQWIFVKLSKVGNR